MSDTLAPLWSDEQISREASEATDELDGSMYVRHVISQLLVKMRADYQARIAELEAQLAASRWEPVTDGTYSTQHNGAYIEIDRDYLKVFEPLLGRDYGDEAEVGLPDGIRVCRRTGGATNE